jgi:hypothetical protein
MDIFLFLPIHSFLQQSVVHFFATILRIAKFSSSIQFVNVQDLGRTFPMHPWIDSADGRAALRRLLVAYSFRDSRVGYCQVSPPSTHTPHYALSLTLEIPIAK